MLKAFFAGNAYVENSLFQLEVLLENGFVRYIEGKLFVNDDIIGG